jgi:hypothetical protein
VLVRSSIRHAANSTSFARENALVARCTWLSNASARMMSTRARTGRLQRTTRKASARRSIVDPAPAVSSTR